MLNPKQNWRSWLIVLIALGFVCWIVIDSSSFQNCMQQNKGQTSQQSLEKGIANIFITLTLGKGCTGYFLKENGEGVIAIFTIVLAISTFLLWGVTRTAADAAKRAADAAVNVELPILTLRRAYLKIPTTPAGVTQINAGDHLLPNLEPRIAFINWGRTPAEITAGCLEWNVASHANGLPSVPNYQNVLKYAPGVVVTNRSDIPLDVPCTISLTTNQVLDLNNSQEFLWVFGFIGFKDFLGEPHEVRFCLKWSIRREAERGPFGFVWDDETPSEYTKRT
jgi:hypothetical protein